MLFEMVSVNVLGKVGINIVDVGVHQCYLRQMVSMLLVAIRLNIIGDKKQLALLMKSNEYWPWWLWWFW